MRTAKPVDNAGHHCFRQVSDFLIVREFVRWHVASVCKRGTGAVEHSIITRSCDRLLADGSWTRSLLSGSCNGRLLLRAAQQHSASANARTGCCHLTDSKAFSTHHYTCTVLLSIGVHLFFALILYPRWVAIWCPFANAHVRVERNRRRGWYSHIDRYVSGECGCRCRASVGQQASAREHWRWRRWPPLDDNWSASTSRRRSGHQQHQQQQTRASGRGRAAAARASDAGGAARPARAAGVPDPGARDAAHLVEPPLRQGARRGSRAEARWPAARAHVHLMSQSLKSQFCKTNFGNQVDIWFSWTKLKNVYMKLILVLYHVCTVWQSLHDCMPMHKTKL